MGGADQGHLGNTIVVENMGGAGGGIGAAFVTRQRPDGYTLLLGGATTHITEGLLKTKPTYDPLKDLEPVSGIAVTAFAIAIHPSVPANNLKELIAYIKANPGKLSYGSAGHGSLNHLTGELLKLRAGITDLPHVAYRGAGPALNDILAGQIPIIVPAMTGHRAGTPRGRQAEGSGGDAWHAAQGRARTADRRRAGISRRRRAELHRLYFPTGTPKEIVDHVAAANLKLMADTSFQEFLVKGTFEIEPPLSTEKYKQYVEDEMKRWRPIVTAMGIKID